MHVPLFPRSMSDLALPFLLLMEDDALAFAAFKSFMQQASSAVCGFVSFLLMGQGGSDSGR
eukprot:1156480-Pelagomonas_calceolata.AAC.3